MARLFYMALAGVGRWDRALGEAGAQFRPYRDHLRASIQSAETRKPVLSWRAPTTAEAEACERRLRERFERQARRARDADRRRDRKSNDMPSGVWVVLEPPPWNGEEPEATFEAFFDAKTVFDDRDCPRDTDLYVRTYDRECNALLLNALPTPVPQDEKVAAPPTSSRPHGPLLWVKPNTHPLRCQQRALQDLENRPTQRHAPLLRLAVKDATWPDLWPEEIDDDEWSFLKDPSRDGTDEQREFVRIALATPDFAVLDGPPGSGKTTAICELIVQLAKQNKRVLLVASTHVAVDNVLERLIVDQDKLGEQAVLPVRIGDENNVTSDKVEPWVYKYLEKTWRGNLLDFLESPRGVDSRGDAARAMMRDALLAPTEQGASALTRLILESANLVCGTTIGILQHPAIKQAAKGGETFEPFDVMILDEASKTTLGEFLVPARHANRWVVVGDVRQLSPFVEEEDLSASVRTFLPLEVARASLHGFLASRSGPRIPSLLAVADEAERRNVLAELDAREAIYADLGASPVTLNGVDEALPELLFADLVLGTSDEITAHEYRLPGDLQLLSGRVPQLPSWQAHRKSCRTPREDVDWASEVSWRLVRSYELRRSPTERATLLTDIERLNPTVIDDDRAQGLKRKLADLRRVVLPSVLELLQVGFEKLDGWADDVALTAGLPRVALSQRLVSLSFQHRMHPDVSEFPREQFYVEPIIPPRRRAVTIWDSDFEQEDPPEPEALLRDAAGLADRRHWTYTRYPRRAQWIDVAPRKGRQTYTNANDAEADRLLSELEAFTAWAVANPRRSEDGAPVPWEVAVLTFYRGQERLLRERLRAVAGQQGNSRTFRFPRGKDLVHVGLGTVDRFQGHEADVVLLSFARVPSAGGAVGFLNSPNRLNVALTRARFQLVLIGHRSAFASARCRSPLLRSLATSPFYQGDIAWETTS